MVAWELIYIYAHIQMDACMDARMNECLDECICGWMVDNG